MRGRVWRKQGSEASPRTNAGRSGGSGTAQGPVIPTRETFPAVLHVHSLKERRRHDILVADTAPSAAAPLIAPSEGGALFWPPTVIDGH